MPRLPATTRALPWLILLLAGGLPASARARDDQAGPRPAWPPPAALHSLLRQEVPGLDLPPPPADATNSEAYLRTLAPHVLLPDPRTPTANADATHTPPISKSTVYQTGQASHGYLRIDAVHAGLPAALASALSGLTASNQLQGLILDLRFAGGSDFPSAAQAASELARRPNREFRLGEDPWPIDPRTTAPDLPVFLLVNRQTREAAEALAAAVRATTSPSLVIGTNTAGAARLYRPVPVAPDLEVRVAQASLVLPGGRPLPADGLAPDLAVAVSEADEHLYRTNEFRRFIDGQPLDPNGAFRMNEAELIRRQRNLRAAPSHPAPATPGPSVQDPVLGRALDLLDGLAQTVAPPHQGDSR